MEKEIIYNREKTIAAWHQFIETGTVPEGSVRPYILASWERCRELGVDPFGVKYPRFSRTMLKKKQEEHKALLSYAIPVMHAIHTTLAGGGLSLSSPDLFTYYMLSDAESDPQSYGIFLNEEECGNTAMSICAHEHRPVSIHRYEKYRVVDQTVSSSAAPIYDADGETVGYISVVAPGGVPTETIEKIACVGSAVLTAAFSEEITDEEKLISLLSEIIEIGRHATLIINPEGTIVAANSDCRRFLKVEENGVGIGITEALVNKEDVSFFAINSEAMQKKYFNIRTIYGNIFNCEVLAKAPVSFSRGRTYTAITIDVSPPGRQVSKRPEFEVEPLRVKSDDVEYIGSSLAWSKVDNIVRKVARFPSNVFLEGESGTGKEVVARTIHRLSGRKGNFVAINCGDIPEGLLQSELYGYEKGSFTGAKKEGSIGKLEYADGGTVFLDEIGDMPFPMQVSLLRFLQERTIQRVGSNKSKSIDVRIVAATNKNIEKMLADQTFRHDLYYRLNVINIKLPPLRERKDDIKVLAEYFLETICKMYGMPEPEVDSEVYRIFRRYDWKGNVRELRNVMEKLLIMSGGDKITPATVYTYIFSYDEFNNAPGFDAGRKIGRDEIESALTQNEGNVTKAAAELGITRDTLYRRMRKYGITNER